MRMSTVGLLAMLVTGCGDSGPDPIDVQGGWSGPVQNNTGTTIAQMNLTLAESGGNVTGSGNLTGDAVAAALTVVGTYSQPSLSLTLSSQGFNDINLTATVAATTMTGTLAGSGFVGSSITLTRQ